MRTPRRLNGLLRTGGSLDGWPLQGTPGPVNSIGKRPPNVPALVPYHLEAADGNGYGHKPGARALTETGPVNQTGLASSHRGNGLDEPVRALSGSRLPRDVSYDTPPLPRTREERKVRDKGENRERESER